MRIAIVGSRSIYKENISRFIPECATSIVTGGAMGIDKLAEREAYRRGLPVTIYYPDYAKHGKAAPLIRNKQIVNDCDMLIAFWDGQSRGTMHAFNFAKKMGKPVRLFKLINNN